MSETEPQIIKQYIEKIEEYTTQIDDYTFQYSKDAAVESIRLLSASIFALSKDALYTIKNNHIFSACSLTCLIIEAEINLLALDLNYQEHGKDYIEFGYIEQLHSLRQHPDWREEILKRMQQHNCERFFKQKKGSMLNIKSYKDNWYNTIAPNLKELAKTAFPHLYDIMQEDTKNIPSINILYENYHTLCSFNYFAPFVVGTEFPVKNNFLEAFKDDYKVIACSCVYSALLVTFTILNRHGEKFHIS